MNPTLNKHIEDAIASAANLLHKPIVEHSEDDWTRLREQVKIVSADCEGVVIAASEQNKPSVAMWASVGWWVGCGQIAKAIERKVAYPGLITADFGFWEIIGMLRAIQILLEPPHLPKDHERETLT